MKEKKNLIGVLLIALALFSVVFISGCAGQTQTSIKNEEQVGQAVTNISDNINDVSTILNDIDSKLG